MGKIYTRKILFVIAAMLLCVLVAILIRLFFSNRTIRMTLTPIEVETGEAVHYADSTRNARSWLWEFGNGDISHERSGEYVFKEPGRYQVVYCDDLFPFQSSATKYAFRWTEDWKGNRSSQYTRAGMTTEATNLSG